MKRLLVILVSIGAIWPKDSEAKITYYVCSDTTMKLDEPLIGNAKFYFVIDGELLPRPSVITEDFIRWWGKNEKRPNKQEPDLYINRYTGEFLSTYNAGFCKTINKPL